MGYFSQKKKEVCIQKSGTFLIRKLILNSTYLWKHFCYHMFADFLHLEVARLSRIVDIKLLGLFSWTLEEEWIFLFCKLLSVFNKFTRVEAIGSRSEGYGSSALIVVSFVVISAILGELSFNLGVIKFLVISLFEMGPFEIFDA